MYFAGDNFGISLTYTNFANIPEISNVITTYVHILIPGAPKSPYGPGPGHLWGPCQSLCTLNCRPLGPYEALWVHSGTYGPKCAHMGPMWQILSRMGSLGPYGPIEADRAHMGRHTPFGATWAHSGFYRVMSSHVGSYGPIWIHMGPYGLAWAHTGPYGPYGIHTCPYGPI